MKLYTISKKDHSIAKLKEILKEHPEIKFVSFMGIDIGGNSTDEKIPINLFIKDMKEMLKYGIQTDGSSVELQGIAVLNNARVDLIPDIDCTWFVDYNHDHYDTDSESEIGTLRIPSFLVHNNKAVCSRSILKRAEANTKKSVLKLLKESQELCKSYGFSFSDVEEVLLTSATELEMWVQTPEHMIDLDALYASQSLKEQYWKRTLGPVRTVMEQAIMELEKYGLQPEMAHKEVGGITNTIDATGHISHVMEQLEIDWKYSSPLQAADNEIIVREVLEELFRSFYLTVSFKAKPIDGVAGNGEHVHLGIAIKLKNGDIINLFTPKDMKKDYLSEIGYGAIMGILKNYEIINPFVTATNDAFNRLKPGFEAPVCIVTSLGGTKEAPSRNRSVLVGVIRDFQNPLATRFELRSPNPYSNTYLVISACFQAMLDGIANVLKLNLSTKQLEKEISKNASDNGKYLLKGREYRSEEDVFEHYTEEERQNLFGVAPATVWENLCGFRKCANMQAVLKKDDVFTDEIINSFELVTLDKWVNELQGRIIPNYIDLLRTYKKLHIENECDLDVVNWENVTFLKTKLMKDTLHKKSIFTRLLEALEAKSYEEASELQIKMNEKITEARLAYSKYKRNIF